MSTQHTNDRQRGHGIRIITAIIAGLTRAVAEAVLHHLTTGC